MFSLYNYSIPGKDGLLLCQEHGRQPETKEVVVLDQVVTVVVHLTITECVKRFDLLTILKCLL